MVECDYNSHSCFYCGRCEIEAKKQERCKVDNMPVDTKSTCYFPCQDDCEAVKEDS